MTNKAYPKLFNDPIYGLIELPKGLLLELVEHPFYQRLRRIGQLGWAHYVYPGATHSRFSHCLGAYYLMRKALGHLQRKGIALSEAEIEACSAAILLHDLGHGPFSHSLEYELLDIAHEEISLALMQALNEQMQGRLDLAIAIFKGEYKRPFLQQLVSGQLDMDRMDYLNRDSFYTGVADGIVSYDRLCQLLTVVDEQLVLEQKAIYSIERFLMARRLMYWQVYLHKNSISTSQQCLKMMQRARQLKQQGENWPISSALAFFLDHKYTKAEFWANPKPILAQFNQLDDSDIYQAIKCFAQDDDFVLSFLAQGLLHRQLFKIELQDQAFAPAQLAQIGEELLQKYPITEEELPFLLYQGQQELQAYTAKQKAILVQNKAKQLLPLSAWPELELPTKVLRKYYLSYPKR